MKRVVFLLALILLLPLSAKSGAPRPVDENSGVEPTVFPSKGAVKPLGLKPVHTGIHQIQIKVRVLSRYDLNQVEITSPLGRLKALKRGGALQEALWPPGVPLQVKAKGSEMEVLIENSVFKADQLVVEAPVKSLLTVLLGGDLEKRFSGRLSLRSSKGSLVFIEELPLEEYVRGVLEAEIPYGFPPEALKAQAVLIRTFALKNLGRHAKEGYHLCDLTHCQAYAGREKNSRSSEQAVKETRSIILVSNFQPIEALYHSTCGGHTSAFHRIYGGPMVPYLMGVDDLNYCEKSPHQEWESSIPLKIMEEVLKKDTDTNPRGEINNLKPVDREAGGRIFTLAIEGKRNFDIPVVQFMSVIGRYLGWSKVKSNWFEVEVKDGEAHFKGRGLGHGMGMCQYGAKGMADVGKKFDEILFHYFPATNLIQK